MLQGGTWSLHGAWSEVQFGVPVVQDWNIKCKPHYKSDQLVIPSRLTINPDFAFQEWSRSLERFGFSDWTSPFIMDPKGFHQRTKKKLRRICCHRHENIGFSELSACKSIFHSSSPASPSNNHQSQYPDFSNTSSQNGCFKGPRQAGQGHPCPRPYRYDLTPSPSAQPRFRPRLPVSNVSLERSTTMADGQMEALLDGTRRRGHKREASATARQSLT